MFPTCTDGGDAIFIVPSLLHHIKTRGQIFQYIIFFKFDQKPLQQNLTFKSQFLQNFQMLITLKHLNVPTCFLLTSFFLSYRIKLALVRSQIQTTFNCLTLHKISTIYFTLRINCTKPSNLKIIQNYFLLWATPFISCWIIFVPNQYPRLSFFCNLVVFSLTVLQMLLVFDQGQLL